MLTYLFIGLFVATINTLCKIHFANIGKVSTPASMLTFTVATIIWPLATLVMVWKAFELYGKNSNS